MVFDIRVQALGARNSKANAIQRIGKKMLRMVEGRDGVL